MICNAKDLAVAIEWCRREQLLQDFSPTPGDCTEYETATFRGAMLFAAVTEPRWQHWFISTNNEAPPLQVAPWVIDTIRVMGDGAAFER